MLILIDDIIRQIHYQNHNFIHTGNHCMYTLLDSSSQRYSSFTLLYVCRALLCFDFVLCEVNSHQTTDNCGFVLCLCCRLLFNTQLFCYSSPTGPNLWYVSVLHFAMLFYGVYVLHHQKPQTAQKRYLNHFF